MIFLVVSHLDKAWKLIIVEKTRMSQLAGPTIPQRHPAVAWSNHYYEDGWMSPVLDLSRSFRVSVTSSYESKDRASEPVSE